MAAGVGRWALLLYNRVVSGKSSDDERVDFFVSYTAHDRRWAEWIAWQAEAAGYAVRVQAWDFLPGSDFVHEMSRALQAAERVVAIWSEAYFASSYAESEWRAAFASDPSGRLQKLLPVRVESCELPALLAGRVYVDLVGVDADTARHRLRAALRQRRGKPSFPPPFPRERLPKYPGDPDWRHGVLSRDPHSPQTGVTVPAGCVRINTPFEDVAMLASGYECAGHMLDDLFTTYLTELVEPLSYGRDWVLTTSRTVTAPDTRS